MSGNARKKVNVSSRLLRRLFSSDANVRAEATRELSRLPPTVLPGILRQAKLLNVQRVFCILGLSVFAVVITSQLLASSSDTVQLMAEGFSLLLALIGGPYLFAGVNQNQVYQCIGDAAASQTSPSAIPALLTLMGPAYLRSRWHELPPSVQVSFCTALRHLLPAITESQYDALNADQKSTLLDLLFLASDTDAFLILQILDMQGRLGDPKNAEIRRILTMLARQDVPVSHKQIPITARTALAELNRRAEQERLAETLLRPSGASAQPARDTHLRPAAAPGKTREEELLRPAKPVRRFLW